MGKVVGNVIIEILQMDVFCPMQLLGRYPTRGGWEQKSNTNNILAKLQTWPQTKPCLGQCCRLVCRNAGTIFFTKENREDFLFAGLPPTPASSILSFWAR